MSVILVIRSLYTVPSQFHIPAMRDVITRWRRKVVLSFYSVCLFSCLSGRYLSHSLRNMGTKVKMCFGEDTILFYFLIHQLIDYLIIINLLVPYLFYFSSWRYFRHLLSSEADIWTWWWTGDLALNSIFDLLIHQLIIYFFD